MDRTLSTRTGAVASLLRSGSLNSWGPPMPGCMVNRIDTEVEAPGARVV